MVNNQQAPAKIKPVKEGPVTVEWLNEIGNIVNLMNNFTIAFGSFTDKTNDQGALTINLGENTTGDKTSHIGTMINGPFLVKPTVIVSSGKGNAKTGGEEHGGVFFSVLYDAAAKNKVQVRALKVSDGKPLASQSVTVNWVALAGRGIK